jgi:hypothetical protein
MGTTINPAVSGVSYRRWIGHVIIFAVGVALGAFLTFLGSAALFGVLRVLGTNVAIAGATALIAVGVSRDVGLTRRVPYRDETQVPEWLRKTVAPSFTAFAYGTHLGIGFLTRYTYSTHLAFVVALPFLDSLPQVLATIGVFAVSKCVVIVLSIAGRSYGEFERRNLYRFRSRRHGFLALRVSNAVVAVIVGLALVFNS